MKPKRLGTINTIGTIGNIGASALCVLGSGLSLPAFATQYMNAEQAQKLMFPQADQFRPSSVQLNLEQMKDITRLSGLPARSAQWQVYAAYQKDQLQGYVVIDEVIGKYELIRYAVGLNVDASLRQIEILDYRESHGYEIRTPAWRKQFIGKRAQQGLRLGEDIANISGATLSCQHVTDGVRRIAALIEVLYKK